jgi:CBS domain-containing protein
MPVLDVANLRPVTVSPDDTVKDAIVRMVVESVGSVAVCEGTRLVGIFTERDVLRLASEDARFGDLGLAEVMTRRLVTVTPDDDIVAVAHLMGERRIRHVPVLEGENLVGMIGIRDVLGVLAEKLWATHDEAARETVHELLARPPRA